MWCWLLAASAMAEPYDVLWWGSSKDGCFTERRLAGAIPHRPSRTGWTIDEAAASVSGTWSGRLLFDGDSMNPSTWSSEQTATLVAEFDPEAEGQDVRNQRLPRLIGNDDCDCGSWLEVRGAWRFEVEDELGRRITATFPAAELHAHGPDIRFLRLVDDPILVPNFASDGWSLVELLDLVEEQLTLEVGEVRGRRGRSYRTCSFATPGESPWRPPVLSFCRTGGCDVWVPDGVPMPIPPLQRTLLLERMEARAP
ncbi:MAG: hypothetical protein KC621_33355 [Myxococcales bacterium]|nr:hypothetical protein [Myxococcales bacterium]